MVSLDFFVASSPAMRPVASAIAHAARSGGLVVVTGERGTGKTRVAREIHARRETARRHEAFETTSCRSLPAGGLDRELLDPRRRSGTLYLTDLDALDPARRVKLLRALDVCRDERTCVIVSTTPTALHDLGRALPAGVATIQIPPLRERHEDIVPLADAFLLRAADERRIVRFALTREAASALEEYAWPGNLRELETVIVRAVVTTRGSLIERAALALGTRRSQRPGLPADLASLRYREVLAHARDLLTHDYLVAVLEAEGGNVTQAAARAGVERESLHRLLKRYGVQAESFRAK
jgi:DNA-binding NtrC family response regulator